MRELVLQMLRSGKRPFEIARSLSLPYETVHTIASESGIHFPGKHLTEDQKKELRRLRELEGLPIRTIATRMGVSKTTVGRWSRLRYIAIQSEGGKFQPEMLKVPKRCPRHGLVRLWPCVACNADPI